MPPERGGVLMRWKVIIVRAIVIAGAILVLCTKIAA